MYASKMNWFTAATAHHFKKQPRTTLSLLTLYLLFLLSFLLFILLFNLLLEKEIFPHAQASFNPLGSNAKKQIQPDPPSKTVPVHTLYAATLSIIIFSWNITFHEPPQILLYVNMMAFFCAVAYFIDITLKKAIVHIIYTYKNWAQGH